MAGSFDSDTEVCFWLAKAAVVREHKDMRPNEQEKGVPFRGPALRKTSAASMMKPLPNRAGRSSVRVVELSSGELTYVSGSGKLLQSHRSFAATPRRGRQLTKHPENVSQRADRPSTALPSLSAELQLAYTTVDYTL